MDIFNTSLAFLFLLAGCATSLASSGKLPVVVDIKPVDDEFGADRQALLLCNICMVFYLGQLCHLEICVLYTP